MWFCYGFWCVFVFLALLSEALGQIETTPIKNNLPNVLLHLCSRPPSLGTPFVLVKIMVKITFDQSYKKPAKGYHGRVLGKTRVQELKSLPLNRVGGARRSRRLGLRLGGRLPGRLRGGRFLL